MRIGVVADDLTGAGDVALAFEKAGFKTEISLWPPSSPPPAGFVWVMSTESRALPPAAARARVRRAAGRLRRWKAAFVFKKIDSTLRGPLSAELDGFQDAIGTPAPVPFVPASPALGRTTQGGRHFVSGVALHRTAFGRDPGHPLRTDRIADIVGKPWAERLWSPDVTDAASLRRAAKTVFESGARFAVGSAGFAAVLAGFLRKGSPAKSERQGAAKAKNSAPVLLVSGSAHPLSRRQANLLRRAAPAGVEIVEAPRRRTAPAAVLKGVVGRAAAAARRLGARRFAVTGGETASALARALGVRRWRVLRALAPGIPLCVSSGGRSTWWVTKPGGFGKEDVWKRVIKHLSKT